MLHRSHFPVQDWFWAAYLVSTHTLGLSARQLRRQMSCSYKTVWFLLHRLRRAMVRPECSALSRIHADERTIRSFSGGKRRTRGGGRYRWLRGRSETARAGYLHQPSLHLTVHIHRAFSNLKTGLAGTHHGVEPKGPPRYLDEFVFRYNRRKTPMAALQSLWGIASSIPPHPVADLTLPESTG